MGFDPRTCLELLHSAQPMQSFGKVNKVVGLVAEASGISASLGAVCHILPDDGGEPVAAEVVGFRDGNILFMPYGEMRGVRPGQPDPQFQPASGVSGGAGPAGAGI